MSSKSCTKTTKRKGSSWRQYYNFTDNHKNAAKCKFCPKVLRTCSNTTNLKQHMERKHSGLIRNEEGDAASSEINSTLSEDSTESTAPTSSGMVPTASKRQKTQTETGIEASFSKINQYGLDGAKTKEITDTIAEMIYRDNLPFCVVEGEGFRKLIKLLAPLYKVPCRNTITNIIDKKYEEKKAILINKLQSVNNICLTIDEWKDLQLKSYLGVTIHFVENFKMVSFNIACEPLSESHTAEYLSNSITDICRQWQIPDEKVISVTTDNAANIVKSIEMTFGRARHVRCVAHTLNLVVQNSVTAEAVKTFIEKVRRIVTWFHQSGVGADELRNSQKTENVPEGKIKHLIGDICTRWNSQLHMLERFVAMSATVGAILLNHPSAPPMVQASEIAVMKEMVKILKPFEKVSEEMSSQKYVSASKVIPMMKCLREYLEETELSHELAEELKNSLIHELKKRFENIQKVHLFSMATFLDPRFKKLHLDDGHALARTINFIKRSIQDNRDPPSPQSLPSTSSIANDGNDAENDIWANHKKLLAQATRTTSTSAGDSYRTSELDLYIPIPVADLKEDALQIWETYKGPYPKLTRLACQYLLVPASSAPAERLFSKAGSILTKTRSRILSKRLPKILFLNSLPTGF